MTYIKSLLTAIGTYSIIPVPSSSWNDDSCRYTICFFPIIGIIIAIAQYALYKINCYMDIDILIYALIATLIPIIITGGIHLDGYMDTVDAFASHKDKDEMLHIMKDHCNGAFAIIHIICYMLTSYVFFYCIYKNISSCTIVSICIGYILSRCIVAMSVIILPNARGSGMLSSITGTSLKGMPLLIITSIASICFIADIYLCGITGLVAASLAIMISLIILYMIRKCISGITGDTCGYLLTICELCILIGTYVGSVLSSSLLSFILSIS